MPKTNTSFIMMKPWAVAKAVELITKHGTYPNEEELDQRYNLPLFVYNRGWDDARVAEALTSIYQWRLNGHKFSRQHIYKVRLEMVGPQKQQYAKRGTGASAQRKLREAEQAERQQVMTLDPPQQRGNGHVAELLHAHDRPVTLEMIQPIYNCLSQLIEQQRIIIANQERQLTGESNTD